MPLDPSIILGTQTPQIQNPIDQASKLLTMKSLADRSQLEGIQTQSAMRDFNDQTSLRNAYQNNTQIDENGNASIDRQGILKDLAKTSPTLVPKVQQQFAEQSSNILQAHMKQLDIAGQLLGGVNDQASYDQAKAQAQGLGLDVSQFPAQYDPNVVRTAQMRTMSAKDQLEQQAKQQGLDIQAKEADIKAKELGMKVTQNSAEQNQQTLGALQALRGNPALQRAETNVLAAKNMNDLAEQVRDPKTGQLNLNNLTPRQVNLVDHELIRMATGGTGNESDMENLKPGTPQYKLAELHQKLTGKMSPAQAGAFVQQGLDYANALSKSSNEFLYQNAKHVVDAKRNYLAPQDQQKYDQWLSDMKTGKSFFGDVAGNPISQSGGGSGQGIHPDLQGKSLADLMQMKNDMLKKQQANK